MSRRDTWGGIWDMMRSALGYDPGLNPEPPVIQELCDRIVMKIFLIRALSLPPFLKMVQSEALSHVDYLQSEAPSHINDLLSQTREAVDKACRMQDTLKQLPKTMKSLRDRVEKDLEADFKRLCDAQVLLGDHTEQMVDQIVKTLDSIPEIDPDTSSRAFVASERYTDEAISNFIARVTGLGISNPCEDGLVVRTQG